ncbi:META domain-containing protein [Chryseobacterium salipaludis]|uniref:META domain-containing protein n=1 Tax=Chryseobacterium TaxID=59732 RepID=UPI001FF3BE2E|nr:MULTISPECIES: META domain-containing protein [Chryseobacterium]MCJ8497718.1 META domain-containing protein [Chryseobacterium salipaludis]MCX3297083.1 META domain-containing protein [Planobacterium sp. JC490]
MKAWTSVSAPVRHSMAALALATGLFSCTTMGVSRSKVGSSQANISNTQWTLAETLKGKQPTLVIEPGKVTGNGGCNNYFGELLLDPTVGNFEVKNVGATKMACPNLSEESTYFSTLSAANKYVVSGNTLELYKDNLLLLKFTKK